MPSPSGRRIKLSFRTWWEVFITVWEKNALQQKKPFPWERFLRYLHLLG